MLHACVCPIRRLVALVRPWFVYAGVMDNLPECRGVQLIVRRERRVCTVREFCHWYPVERASGLLERPWKADMVNLGRFGRVD